MKGLFERAAELARAQAAGVRSRQALADAHHVMQRARAAEVRSRQALADAHHVMQQARDAVQWMTGAEAVALRAALDDAINQSHAVLITRAQPGVDE